MSVSPDSRPAVIVDGVSKAFELPREKVHTLKERVLHPFRRRQSDRLEALRDVSFSVQPGEFFGIVGRNGSGKSTLLKCMAGIYGVDKGEIYIDGRLSTFIELGVGFNPDLAARDNVTLNGIMLGLSPKEARARVDRVIEFAELEEFVDLKLKNYSSGMQVRLAFSVMIQVDADVLLIDEVLAVGDASFQQKCFDVFNRLRDEGKTILFVTHDMAAVQRFCHRALLLERGEIVEIGEPDRVGSNYIELNFGRETSGGPESGEEERYGDGRARIREVWFEDETGERSTVLEAGQTCTFRARIVFEQRVENPAAAIVFENEHHHPLFATSSLVHGQKTGVWEPGEEAVLSVSFDNVFAPGRVFASPWVTREGGDLIDRRPRMASIVVTSNNAAGGFVDLPHEVSLEHSGGREPTASL